ncbi:spindle and kinetochore-associated protein 3-like isoform X3 [Polyodon spathula]|uniref:spindle and kinetochore-associated protein 3-like isoform X3 n=1 Tax=Polyodon spathula TaxID=7913 RepID=UPI001B7EB318|nr:spindle and kinetochore-associated protein 3-like isoform X3 [Polyodon spathula]
MDISGNFFRRLRNVATFLETETKTLKKAHENSSSDDYKEEGAMQVLHELHSEVQAIKGQVKTQVISNQSVENNASDFLRSCCVLKQRNTANLEKIKEYFQKYGYKPLAGKTTVEIATNSNDEECMEDQENSGSEEEEEDKERTSESLPCATPAEKPPAPQDPMRTPRLSDFGLSHYRFQNTWEVVKEKPEQPAVTQDSVGQGDLRAPTFTESFPVLPKTPKCMLELDNEAFTPKMEDFGINEYTMCLNDDFTIALINKNKPTKPKSLVGVTGSQTNTGMNETHSKPTEPTFRQHLAANDMTNSPVPPVFCTPGIKIYKNKLPTLPKSPEITVQKASDSTPEIPTFETPYLKKLVHQRNTENETKTLPEKGNPADRFSFEEPCPPVFSSRMFATEQVQLVTPLSLAAYDHMPEAPERPELTAMTEGILKSKHDDLMINKTGKENRSPLVHLAMVSEKEFFTLPDYLRQIPLSEINTAIQKINKALERKSNGNKLDPSTYLMEEKELWNIIEVGPQATIYLLCITELNRLEQVTSSGTGSAYRIIQSD